MLSLLRQQVARQVPRSTRMFFAVVAPSNVASTSTAPPPPSPPSSTPSASSKTAYFVPRNTRGNLPVYTDVRNAGGRYFVLIRNIEGNTSALIKDLTRTLFEKDSPESSRMKIQINQSKHVVIQGGRWKNEVVDWLKKKGF